MIGFDEASALIAEAARPLGTERAPLRQAFRRVLAAPVVARVDSPPFTASSMDGYAVREADVAQTPARLRVVGQSFAGQAWEGELGPGECARIFTGAAAPSGADRVIIQEDVTREGDWISIADPPGPARHLRRKGSDFHVGDVLLSPGRRLDPRALLTAAGADLAEIEVYRRPRLMLLSTGDELVEPGCAAETPGAIPDSLSLGVLGLAEDWGAEPLGSCRLADDPARMTAAARQVLGACDVVVVTGGASVGEKDYAKAMFEPLGLELILSKVAIKPGKPVWFGRAGGVLILGLPGNPTSAYVTARLFLAPLLAGLSGRDPAEALRWRTAAVANGVGPTGPRETFHRGQGLDAGRVEMLADQDSGAQRALSQAEVLIRRRAGAPALTSGELSEVLDL